MVSSKAQAQIISTILLILIAISAAALISTFAIKMVNDKLAESNCLKVSDKIEITNNLDFTCYDASNNLMQIQIHRGESEDISGFVITLGGATTTSYEIIPPTKNPDIIMFDNSLDLEIPNSNEERTYKISTPSIPNSARVYPITKKGKVCETTQTYTNVELC
jgi:flagellin-like protein